ncbi:hypothetical protein LDENG_00022980 [Lucifuga dentata]|nr:hypothetical protein LDENG_00022980 [Lucifuga dentata]
MRIIPMTSIPDRSRPGLTTTAISTVDLQGDMKLVGVREEEAEDRGRSKGKEEGGCDQGEGGK